VALATIDTTVATMTNVAAGAYAIFAKTIVDPGIVDAAWTATCTLDAGSGHTDSAEFTRNDHNATLSMEVTRTFAATGSIVLSCRSTQAAEARVSKIVAIKVDSATREAVSG
jgi:hypothetical protein